MCGIVGIIAKNPSGFFGKDADMFEQLLYANAVRGWDATGVFGVTKLGNVDIKKQAITAANFIATPNFKEFKQSIVQKYHFVMGHNRKATHGEKTDKDSHPFWDKENKICLIHNGMISNHKSFCSKSTVDSAAIANALATTDDMKDVIEKIEGAYAFIWYNVEEKRLHFIRNSARPLFLAETDTTFILSSEESLSYWIAKRNNTTINTSGILEENLPYFIDLENKIFYKENEKIEQKKIITQHQTFLPLSTPPTTTTKSIIIEGETVNNCEENFFLSDSNFKSIVDVKDVIELHSKLLCISTSYEEVANGTNYRINFDIINVDKPFIKCVMYVSPGIFNELDLTNIFEVTVRGIQHETDSVKLYVSNPLEIKSWQVSDNGTVITEVMYFDDRFPLECDVCQAGIKWKDIPYTNVCIENHAVAANICPTCSGKAHA